MGGKPIHTAPTENEDKQSMYEKHSTNVERQPGRYSRKNIYRLHTSALAIAFRRGSSYGIVKHLPSEWRCHEISREDPDPCSPGWE
jgi:hypothetical protein